MACAAIEKSFTCDCCFIAPREKLIYNLLCMCEIYIEGMWRREIRFVREYWQNWMQFPMDELRVHVNDTIWRINGDNLGNQEQKSQPAI